MGMEETKVYSTLHMRPEFPAAGLGLGEERHLRRTLTHAAAHAFDTKNRSGEIYAQHLLFRPLALSAHGHVAVASLLA